MTAVGRRDWKLDQSLSCPRLCQYPRDIMGDFHSLGERPPLRHQTWHIVRRGEVDALRQQFDVEIDELFHDYVNLEKPKAPTPPWR
jgi:hypothetical protein